jgi:hypothetical protein
MAKWQSGVTPNAPPWGEIAAVICIISRGMTFADVDAPLSRILVGGGDAVAAQVDVGRRFERCRLDTDQGSPGVPDDDG